MKTKLLRYLLTFVILGLVTGALARPTPVFAATYVVNTTDLRVDSGDHPCTVDHCSLWEAVIMANMHPGPDRITFNLPGEGPYFIYLGTPEGETYDFVILADDETEIDGTTQPGWPIYLHGMGETGWAILVRSNRNTIRGLGFLGFTEFGVQIQGNDNFLDRVILGEYLKGGLIAGPINNYIGAHITGDNNVVRGAYVANNQYGIWVEGSNNRIEYSHIGSIFGSSTGQGNQEGVFLQLGSGNIIDGNVFLGNSNDGIFVLSNGNTILRNRVGVDNSGITHGNRTGIFLHGLSGGNRVGGTDPYDGNIIVANDVGIFVNSPGNEILNNRIGTDFIGTPIPNRIGVWIYYASDGTFFGSGWHGAGNVIAYNTEDGIIVDSTAQIAIQHNTIHHNGGNGISFKSSDFPPPADGMKVTIRRNSIYDNGGLGINIPSSSYNNGLNSPAGLRFNGGAVTGRSCPGCTVEVFEAAADPSGFGEGKTFLSNGTAGGDGSFNIPVEGLGACSRITATATDALGNTSMFSQNANALLCVRLPVLWAWIIILGGGGAGAGAALLVVVRRRPLTLRRAPWLLLGMAFGIVMAVLLLRLPFVQILLPAPGSQPAPQQKPGIPTVQIPLHTETPSVSTTQPLFDTPTVTLTTTPTNSTPTATLLQNGACRRGPGTENDSVTTIPAGSNVPIVGRNQDSSWWQVQVPGTQTQCWLADENVETSGDTSQVPVVEVEPPACWVKQQQGPDKCVAPCPQGAQPGGVCTP
jgi:parallel beta-helix repeat protein